MLTLVKKWRQHADSIARVVRVTQGFPDEEMIEDDVLLDEEEILSRKEMDAVQKAMMKVASVYRDCADELENKLWEV